MLPLGWLILLLHSGGAGVGVRGDAVRLLILLRLLYLLLLNMLTL